MGDSSFLRVVDSHESNDTVSNQVEIHCTVHGIWLLSVRIKSDSDQQVIVRMLSLKVYGMYRDCSSLVRVDQWPRLCALHYHSGLWCMSNLKLPTCAYISAKL